MAKSSKERNQFKFLVEKKVSLTHKAKSQPLKMMINILSIKTHYSQDSQLEFRANVNKIFMNPAKKYVKLHFLPYFMTCASIINERRHIGALSQKRNILIYITSLLRYHKLTSAGMKKLQLIWRQISNWPIIWLQTFKLTNHTWFSRRRGGGMCQILWLFKICHLWNKNGQIWTDFQVLLRLNQAMFCIYKNIESV